MIIPVIIALLAAGCALPPFSEPSDDRPNPRDDRDDPDQKVEKDGQVVRDGGVDAADGSDLGNADVGLDVSGDGTPADRADGGSEYVPPTSQRPTNQSTLPPTQGFFKWRNNTPAGRSVTDEKLCETTGDPLTVEENCFSVLSPNSCYTADPLERNANYSWKIQTCYDGGECSERSGLQTFSTDDSLLARWRLDEGSGDIAADSSGVAAPNDGTLINFPTTPRWIQGVRGSALQFNGGGTAVYIGDKFGGIPQVTIGVWVKTTSPGSNRAIMARSVSGQHAFALTMSDQGNGKVRFTTFTTTRVSVDSTTSINDGNWHFVMGTYNGKQMSISVDGNVETSAPQSGNISSTPADLCIGDYCMGGNAVQLGFEGFIDEPFILQSGLNLAQGINEYCAPYCSPNPNPPGPLPAICQ